MKTKLRIAFLLLSFCLILFSSCGDEWEDRIPQQSNVKKGFVYDILKNRGNFTIYLQAAERIGYNDLLQGKGLSTFFVPTDNTFKRYLKKHNLSSIDDISDDDLKMLIGYHVVKYSYSMNEFMNFQPTQNADHVLPGVCYKHRTLARDKSEEVINPRTGAKIKLFNGEKFLPVFSSNMFNSLGIKDQEDNYKFFFPKSNWYGDVDKIHVANSGVLEQAIPADNGYLYIIDQVIEPLRTVYAVMKDPKLHYSTMQKLYDKFPGYAYRKDLSELYAVPGDSLYMFLHMETVNFSLLSVASDWTSDRTDWKLLCRDAYNGFVPNDEAMETFFTEFWGDPSLRNRYESYDDLDKLALFYLLDNHFLRTSGVLFPQTIRNGLMNNYGYPYDFDVDGDVEHKEVCANGAFYGINKVQIPTLFETVSRPAFQSPKYKLFSYMLVKSGMLSLLTNKDRKITMFIPSDAVLSAAGYTLNIGDPWNLSTYEVNNGTTKVSVSDLDAIVRYFIIPEETITPADLSGGEQKWYETDRQASFVKIGENRIVMEDGETSVNLGIDEFNTDGRFGPWRAYEVKGMFTLPSFALASDPKWDTWIKEWQAVVNGSDNAGKPLIPFANSRGVMFCVPKDWCKQGENGIPKVNNANKLPVTEWTNKHIFTVKDNGDNLNLLDFMQGNIQGKDLQSANKDFSIRILNVNSSASSPNKKYGQYELDIELPDGRTVKAYGPQYTRDCLLYVLPTASDRFTD